MIALMHITIHIVRMGIMVAGVVGVHLFDIRAVIRADILTLVLFV